MRTIQAVNVRWFNATAWYGLTLARLLRQAGHETLVLTLPGTEADQRALDMALPRRHLPLNATSPLGLLRLYQDMHQLVAEFQPDIVNCHRGEAFVLWGLLRRRLGSFGLVRTRGDQRSPRADPINRWLHHRVADAVIATNSAMADQFRQRLGLPEDHVRVIRGGVDRQRFAPDPAGRARVRSEFGFGPDHWVVGLLGRFDQVKGQRQLMASLAQLRQRGQAPGLRLFLIGFPTEVSTATIQGWLDEAGLADITRLSGERQDVAACINALDLGVVNSLGSEAIARAALEIMACGVPLVGTRVGVMADLLLPWALTPPGDVAAMADLLASLYQNPLALDQLRAHHAATMAHLGLEEFLDQTLAVYRGLRP